MAKKINKFAGMQDMFEQRIIEKTDEFNAAIQKIDEQIASLERYSYQYDSGLGDIEDRNELRYLESEKRHLEQQLKYEIEQLTIKSK